MGEQGSSWVQRHRVFTIVLLNLALFGVLAVIGEFFLRIYIPYNPGYYVSVGGTDREVEYPYGTIRINSLGYPDDEFDLERPRKIGYFGDSVTYGVGAGHGYRVSDLLEDRFPEYAHLNFGGIGLSISDNEIAMFRRMSDRFELADAVYLFNLNDIVPDTVAGGEAPAAVTAARRRLVATLDALRGRSFLYTFVRTRLKNLLEAQGVGFHGYSAFELHPEREQKTLAETAARIVRLHDELAAQGVRLTVVLLPYEMQISEEAAIEYARMGVDWEDGFLDGSTQKAMTRLIGPDVPVVDAYYAFVDPAEPATSLSANGLGEYFVYDRGDKLDWNHPNREGHRAIAEYLGDVQLFGPSEEGVPKAQLAHGDR